MNENSIHTINDKLKTLSDDFIGEILAYLDSLNASKVEFTPDEVNAINQGKSDFENGRLHTHEKAKEIIQEHIRKKAV